ncbi:MAG: MarR family transcriptional regulator [Crocinitomicaceae bacterium]|nr:MarR family transcriptional regulator [Crocinitomicaceae bacterium]|tara:strand:+ start:4411 stop:4857 length:447 start_codon:yes stop_codon:yes gene_type:complete
MDDQLKLQNQLCFPIYTASRLVTQCYHPILKELDLTYPQYLVMLVLWEKDEVNLSFLTEKLMLKTNTLTPLVKRMESMELLTRERSAQDERNIIITLTEKGKQLKDKAVDIPQNLFNNIGISMEKAEQLYALLYEVIEQLEDQKETCH